MDADHDHRVAGSNRFPLGIALAITASLLPRWWVPGSPGDSRFWSRSADGFERHGAWTREFSQVVSVASAGGSP